MKNRMSKRTKEIMPIPNERIIRKIYFIRGQKVIFDKDLAELYEVKTGNLNKAVKRNLDRFPEDFMFQLSKEESKNLKFHLGTSSWGGTRKPPLVFTEQGVAMLSSVLKSKRAVQVNIQIMRTFTKLREMLLTHKELREKIEKMERKYDSRFTVIFNVIKRLLEKDAKEKPSQIGFK